MSSENFPFLGLRNGPVFGKDGTIFEEISQPQYKFSKTIFANGRCLTSTEPTLETHNLGFGGKLPPLLEESCMATESCPLFERHRSALNGNGKLPLVRMAPQRIVWQSSEQCPQTASRIQRRHRLSEPLHGHDRI